MILFCFVHCYSITEKLQFLFMRFDFSLDLRFIMTEDVTLVTHGNFCHLSDPREPLSP